MDGFPLFFATSGPTKRRKHYFCLLFSQYWAGVEKVNVLGTSPKNQIRDYHAWNRIEKLMPQLWNFSPQTFKLYKKRSTCFQTLTFGRNLGFPKPWICPWICPWIFHGFPTPWPGSLGRNRTHEPMAVQPEDPKAIHRERPIPIDRNSRERHCIPNRSE